MDPSTFTDLPPARELSEEARDRIHRHLLDGIGADRAVAPGSGRKRRPLRRVGTAVVVSALFTGVTAAAATTLWDYSRPQPDQAATVSEVLARPRSKWRQPLGAEQVICSATGEAGPTISASVEFPIEDLLTVTDIRRACLVDAATPVCVPIDGRPLPFILRGGDCATVDQRHITDDDIAALNRMRALDVAILAIGPDPQCPTYDEAVAWTNARIAEYGEQLQVVPFPKPSARWDYNVACFRGLIQWSTNRVLIGPLGPQRDGGNISWVPYGL